VIEEPLFTPEPAPIPAERAVCANHTVAGHDNGQIVHVHGAASLAGSIATMNRFALGAEKFDVARTRFSRAAGRATEHPGGLHRHVEYAFGTYWRGRLGASTCEREEWTAVAVGTLVAPLCSDALRWAESVMRPFYSRRLVRHRRFSGRELTEDHTIRLKGD
jgi:hypothetical protein